MARKHEEPKQTPVERKPSVVGLNLERLRVERGMTQDDVAVAAGISRVSVNSLESGRMDNPGSKTVEALAGALGVDASELMKGGGAAAAAQPASDGRISLSQFLSVARGVLEPEDVGRLEKLRTRLDPRGLSRRAWLRTVIDLREDDTDGDDSGTVG